MRHPFAAIPLLVLLAAGPVVHAGDEPKNELFKSDRMSLDSFKLALRDAKSVEEKASLLHAFGRTASGDAPTVTEIARFIGPFSGDSRLLLPTTAIAVLARQRGNRLASQSLIQALPAFKKSPYLQKKLLGALAQVGHESAIPSLEEILRSGDEDLSLFVIAALRELPPDAALDLLIRSWEWMEGRKSKVPDALRDVFNRVGGEMLKLVQEISGERYPTMTEMARWWPKHATEWKEKAAARERDREKQRASVGAELPPLLIAEFLFNERGGAVALNGGASSTWCPSGAITKVRPVWSNEVPPSGGGTSLDWGKDAGSGAVDLPGGAEHLKTLKSFTVTGWINCRSSTEGKGGNRIVSWLDREGVEIVYRADGSLQVGIHQKAEESEVRTPSGMIPLIMDGVGNSLFDSWRFFAVTCDAATGEIKIYIGERGKDAALSVSRQVAAKAGVRVAAALSIGNVPPASRIPIPNAGFRGLIDEIRIFGSTWDGSGALPAGAIIKIQGRS